MNIVYLALFVIGFVDTISILVSVYMFYRFVIKPAFQFRNTKKRGYYVSIHKFDKKGVYNGSVENLSVDETLGYFAKKIFGIMPQKQSISQKIKNAIDNSIDREINNSISQLTNNKEIKDKINKKVAKTLMDNLDKVE